VATSADETKGCVIEINSETDFVARNDQFQSFVRKATDTALSTGASDIEALKTETMDGKSVGDTLTNLIATIGENMTLRRLTQISVSNGVIATYVHNAVADNLGKIGVLVALESTGDKEALKAVGRQIAMHVAAAKPEFLDSASVDPEALERERNVLLEQAKESGKPADIAEKMVEGRIRKYYEEVCLVDQIFIMDGETKIKDVVANAAKDAGAPVTLKGFVRFNLGEGIEKEETDFAAEVAATARSA
jgi:elongation factor Ts